MKAVWPLIGVLLALAGGGHLVAGSEPQGSNPQGMNTNMDIYLQRLETSSTNVSDVADFKSLARLVESGDKNQDVRGNGLSLDQIKLTNLAEVKALLGGLARLEEISEEGITRGPPMGNITPPTQTGFPAGTAPSAIKDETLRKEYEEKLRQNEGAGRKYKVAVEFRRERARLISLVKMRLATYLDNRTVSSEELRDLLRNTRISDACRRELLQDIPLK